MQKRVTLYALTNSEKNGETINFNKNWSKMTKNNEGGIEESTVYDPIIKSDGSIEAK